MVQAGFHLRFGALARTPMRANLHWSVLAPMAIPAAAELALLIGTNTGGSGADILSAAQEGDGAEVDGERGDDRGPGRAVAGAEDRASSADGDVQAMPKSTTFRVRPPASWMVPSAPLGFANGIA